MILIAEAIGTLVLIVIAALGIMALVDVLTKGKGNGRDGGGAGKG